MVDIGDKAQTRRRAVAEAVLNANLKAIATLMGGMLGKGDALAAARIAGIMAAKKTADLIPLCHPVPLTRVEIDIALMSDTSIAITATTETVGSTGVEMEALSAVSVAALTLYDMAKSLDRAMTISTVRLLEKTGGKSGSFARV